MIGLLSIGGDNLAGVSGGGGTEIPGIFLSLLATVAGFLVLSATASGPLATAGAVASALGIPSLVFFLTYSDNRGPSPDAVFLVSTLAWALAYFVGPGRGRPFYFGLALLGLWLFVIEQVEEVLGFSFGFRLIALPFESAFGDPPDYTAVGLLSVGFGAAYLSLGWLLDREGQTGAATPSAAVGLLALFAGIAALVPDLEWAWTGALLALVGTGLAVGGGVARRRGTAWLGGAAVVLGAVLLVGDMAGDATAFGVITVVVGLGFVGFGHWVANAIEEPDEMAVAAPARLDPRRVEDPPDDELDL